MKSKLLQAISISVLAVGLSSIATLSYAGSKLDKKLPEYKKASGVTGNLSSVGSDTLANLMALWTEEFTHIYPNVNVQVQAAGSSTAPPALTEGTSNFGPMSRKMKDRELQAFEKKHGYKPTAIAVAIDALAVYVHKDNPIKGLTIAQVDAIFSSTRKCKAKKNIKKWGDTGLKGSWKNKSIQIYGRNSVSGTYGYFKKKALCKGDYKTTVNEQPGSASVVQSVSASLNGIGYSGIGYKTSGVRAVPLTKKAGKPYIAATPENAANKTYPLGRKLWVYVNKQPNRPLSPMQVEFIKMILSRRGQKIVIKDGYIPLSAKQVKKQLRKLK